MRMTIYDPKAPKKAVNLSINSDLLEKARALGVNLSGEMETRLAEVVRKAAWDRWREENRAGIEANNKRIEEEGLWSDGLRQF
jgi:antitoxin CcdA